MQNIIFMCLHLSNNYVISTIAAAVTSPSNEKHEELDSGSMEFTFRTPDKGKVDFNLFSKNDDIILQVSIRFDWYQWKNVFVLNHKKVGQPWGHQRYPEGFPFESNKTVYFVIEITTKGFNISANHRKMAEYPSSLLSVDTVTYDFDDTGASIKAKLISFKVDY